MAASDHFVSWVRKVLQRWAEPLWANTEGSREGSGEGSRVGGGRKERAKRKKWRAGQYAQAGHIREAERGRRARAVERRTGMRGESKSPGSQEAKT